MRRTWPFATDRMKAKMRNPSENIFCSEAPTIRRASGRKMSAFGLVNGAQSNRHDTASAPWRDGCARSERGEAGPRSSAGWRNDPSDGQPRQPERCRAREREERPAGLAAGKANGRDVCTVGAHSGRIARRLRGALFEVTAFDGWSLRSPAKTALETWPGWKSTSEARPHSMTVHWKKFGPKIQTLENATAAKPRNGALSKLSGRPDRTACVLLLAGCCRHRWHVLR